MLYGRSIANVQNNVSDVTNPLVSCHLKCLMEGFKIKVYDVTKNK